MFTNDERKQLKEAVEAAAEGNHDPLGKLTQTFIATRADPENAPVLAMYNIAAASSFLLPNDEYDKLRHQFAESIAAFNALTPPDQNLYYFNVLDDIIMAIVGDVSPCLDAHIARTQQITEALHQMRMSARQMSMANDPRTLDVLNISLQKTNEYHDDNDKNFAAACLHLMALIKMMRITTEERDKEQPDHDMYFNADVSHEVNLGTAALALIAQAMVSCPNKYTPIVAQKVSEEINIWKNWYETAESYKHARKYWFKHPDEKKELEARIKELTATKANLEEKMKAPQAIMDQEDREIERLEKERTEQIEKAGKQVTRYHKELAGVGVFQRKRKKELTVALENSKAKHEAIKKSANEEYEREAAPHLEKKKQAAQELASLRAQFNPVNNTLKELQDKLWNVKE